MSQRPTAARLGGLLLALVSVLAQAAPAGADAQAPATRDDRSEHIKVAVYVLDFDPLTSDGRPLSLAQGWNDPIALQAQYRADVATASGSIVAQRLVRVSRIPAYPVKADGFRFTDATYHGCLADSTPSYCGELIDYGAVLNTVFDARLGSACEALRRGRVDEVWLWATIPPLAVTTSARYSACRAIGSFQPWASESGRPSLVSGSKSRT